jgi:hypothetical protein
VRRFDVGEEVVVRYLTRVGSGVGMTWPYRVVRDDEELVALYIPTGSTFMRWHTPEPGRRELVEGEWRRDVLRLMYPEKAYSIWLFWEGEGRPFTTYYVNFEEPYRRTAVGFDTNDHTLDIVVAPDLSWRWKDREEFEALVSGGTFSSEFGASVETAAAEVVQLIESAQEPFSGVWPQWFPPEDWTKPVLHPHWQDEPPVVWEKRDWAYPRSHPTR